jgi:glycosyl transferase family 87
MPTHALVEPRSSNERSRRRSHWRVRRREEQLARAQATALLLACMLAAFLALRQNKDRTAGALFAFATACKAFPALSLGYLVYRRQWRAAVAMVVFLGLFLVVLPAPVRGVNRTISELRTWAGGMLLPENNLVGVANDKQRSHAVKCRPAA